jgi:hypothetical protein
MSPSRSFLIDQMFDRLVVAALREEGYDDHFGDWTVLPLSRHPGVIRLKVNPTTTANTLGLLLPFLRRH